MDVHHMVTSETIRGRQGRKWM